MAKEPTKITIEKEIETDRVEGTVLGQRVSAPITYTPDILVKVPREENRKDYGIHTGEMAGYDDWYAYECSTVTTNGVPVYFGLIIRYDATSKYIVESKSLKLYLNSFNMEPLSSTVLGATQEYVNRVQKDLSTLLESNVYLMVFQNDEPFEALTGVDDLADIVDLDKLKITEYNESPDILEVYNTRTDVFWKFSGIRSNCKITNQPDWATAYIRIVGNKVPVPESLVKYLVSFRNESHFHEECCEMIFKRLLDVLQPDVLWVRLNYTRRGGIDINPTRFTKNVNDTAARSRTVYQ